MRQDGLQMLEDLLEQGEEGPQESLVTETPLVFSNCVVQGGEMESQN